MRKRTASMMDQAGELAPGRPKVLRQSPRCQARKLRRIISALFADPNKSYDDEPSIADLKKQVDIAELSNPEIIADLLTLVSMTNLQLSSEITRFFEQRSLDLCNLADPVTMRLVVECENPKDLGTEWTRMLKKEPLLLGVEIEPGMQFCLGYADEEDAQLILLSDNGQWIISLDPTQDGIDELLASLDKWLKSLDPSPFRTWLLNCVKNNRVLRLPTPVHQPLSLPTGVNKLYAFIFAHILACVLASGDKGLLGEYIHALGYINKDFLDWKLQRRLVALLLRNDDESLRPKPKQTQWYLNRDSKDWPALTAKAVEKMLNEQLPPGEEMNLEPEVNEPPSVLETTTKQVSEKKPGDKPFDVIPAKLTKLQRELTRVWINLGMKKASKAELQIWRALLARKSVDMRRVYAKYIQKLHPKLIKREAIWQDVHYSLRGEYKKPVLLMMMIQHWRRTHDTQTGAPLQTAEDDYPKVLARFLSCAQAMTKVIRLDHCVYGS